MRRVKFIGDLHCNTNWKSLFRPNMIQLGDLCLIGYDQWAYPESNKQFFPGPRYFVEGNHEYFPALNPDASEPYAVAENLIHIPRGYVDGKVLFIGGADSIPPDRAMRTPGHDWFPEEAINQAQFDRIMNIEQEIEVIVTHECPTFVAKELLTDKYGTCSLYMLPSGQAMEEIFYKFRPQMWIFAHYHKYMDKTLKGCRFICMGEGQRIELIIPTEKIGEDLMEKYNNPETE